MRWAILVGVALLLSGCTPQRSSLTFETVAGVAEPFSMDISVSEADYDNTCKYSGNMGLSEYRYAEFAQIVDSEPARSLVFDIDNHTITDNGCTHDYLRNKSFINDVEVEGETTILDVPMMDITDISQVWGILTEAYPLEAGTVGEKLDNYEYYTVSRQAVDSDITGATPDRLGMLEYTYIFEDNQVISLGVDVSYYIDGTEFHNQMSLQVLTVN